MKLSSDRRPRRILNSLWLSFALLLTASIMGVVVYRNANADRVPQITGYDWSLHPNALLVVYPMADACRTCNFPVAGWAKEGLRNRLDVLIVAKRATPELKRARVELSSAHLVVLCDVDRSLIEQFTHDDLVGGVRIENGRILARQTGGTPSATFFQPN